MKIVIEKTAFLKTISHVQNAVERRNAIPILANVKIQAEGDSVVLSTTDMEMSITEKVAASVEKKGAITVSASMLHDIVRKLPDGAEVNLNTDSGNDTLSLTSGRSKFSLQTLPVDEFPLLSEGDAICDFTLQAAVLKNMLDRTKFAISTEETRYYLNGIFMHTKGDTLCAVATDGHRLAKIEIQSPKGAKFEDGIIIPRKAVGEINKLLEENDDSIGISLSDNKVKFTIGNIVLISKLIDGKFPDYERVIPKGNNMVLTAECREFAKAVDRVSTVSSDKMRAVKIGLSKNNIKVSAASQEHGNAEEDVPASYNGDELEIGFNSKYLMDISEQIDSGSLKMLLADQSSPSIIQDDKNDNAIYVLMPMRV